MGTLPNFNGRHTNSGRLQVGQKIRGFARGICGYFLASYRPARQVRPGSRGAGLLRKPRDARHYCKAETGRPNGAANAGGVLMAWIREEDVNLPEVIKVMSIQPQAMEAVQRLNMAVTFGASALTRVQEEAIATVVSATNHCRY